MLVRQIFLAFCGLASGIAVASGTFAFLIVIGVIPRIIGKSNRAADAIHFENAVIGGGVFGTIMSVFPNVSIPLGIPLLCVYGLSSGIFVGCMAVALAEILDTFPITFRRFGIKEGLCYIMIAMALGKCVGALFFFFYGYMI